MCNFFSAIITRDGRVLFTEEDSHEEAIKRSGLADDLKHFVRVEYNEECGYQIDERMIPGWYERIAAKAEQNAKAIFTKILPLHTEYDEIERSVWVKYDEIERSAWVEYDKIWQSAWEKYGKLVQPAREKYEKIEESAWEKYGKLVQPARVAYASRIKKIGGYVAEQRKNRGGRK